jgi:anti-sigma factor RsiW
MTCREVERELVAYQFGALEDDARRRVEAHLVACSACVGAFVQVKRAVELGEQGARPSDAAKRRLRRAVARELGVREAKPTAWERALAVGIAACLVLVAGAATRALTSAPGAPPHALSDDTFSR